MKNLKVLGIIFIIIGALSLLGSVVTFDYEEYNFIKKLSFTQSEEILIMKNELFMRWVLGLASLLICSTIGLFLMATEKIIGLLEKGNLERESIRIELLNMKNEKAS